MSEDREKVLRMALKALLIAATDQGVHVRALCEGAIESMLSDIVYNSDDVAQAVIAIEVAAGALV